MGDLTTQALAADPQVRVARSLAEYPLIRQELAAARLSYAKARALTRIVTPEPKPTSSRWLRR